jgi:hypothetical protein
MSFIYNVVSSLCKYNNNIGKFYLSALGVSIIFNVDIIYGFIILTIYFLLFAFSHGSILQPIMLILFMITPFIGLISLF